MGPYAYLEITRSCRKCGRPLPVNGPLEFVRCAACSTVNPVPLGMFHQAFRVAHVNDEKIDGGNTRTQTPLDGTEVYKLTWGTHPPACRSCRTPLADPPAAAGTLPCPACGAPCTTFAPPDWMKHVYPGVAQIYLGVQEEEASRTANPLAPGPSPARPVAMRCGACGGGLSVTADTPLDHSCGFCGTAFRIPDEIWERMHPVEAVQGWFVRFEGPPPGLAFPTSQEFRERYEKHLRPLEDADGRMNRTAQGPSRFVCCKLGNTCGTCKARIPVNGPLLHPVCPTCGAVRDLPPQALGHMLAWVAETKPLSQGWMFHSGYHFTHKMTRVAPYCRRCETDLPLVPPGTDSTIECPKCSATYATFPVPAAIQPHAGAARQIYCADRDDDRPPLRESAPVVHPCPSCGADLTVDQETGRVHRCAFCSNDVFLPDEVWHRFHPVTKILPWFVDAGRVPPSAAAARLAREAAEREKTAAQTRAKNTRHRIAFGLKLAGWLSVPAALLIYAFLVRGGC
ncbi:MAG: hypothetical protein HY907_06960 [Deltaproteobacteria bacterium]|nr:hypothetical protein [Deltaproteobacteria bacterium]